MKGFECSVRLVVRTFFYIYAHIITLVICANHKC